MERPPADFYAKLWHLALQETSPKAHAYAFLASAWLRFPVVDSETDALVSVAEELVSGHMDNFALVLLSEINRLFTAFFIDSGAMYGLADESVRHYDGNTGVKRNEKCVVRGTETVRGACHPYAQISTDMEFWLQQKVSFQDQLRAFRPVTDQKTLVLRLLPHEIQLILPEASHIRVDFASSEPSCLVEAVLDLLKRTTLPPLEIVLNHGDLPLLRKHHGALPRYHLNDLTPRMRSPLFSLTTSNEFWDMLFPNICRPKLHRLPHKTSWEEKIDKAFWRGTDRGAVNWATTMEEMFEGSTRARVLKQLDPLLADAEFIADDLINSTVVALDPNHVPLPRQDEWRLLLDIPGNGYSGSLKQKLTGGSAVLLLTNNGRGEPLVEHYHFGLQEYVHIIPITADNVNDQIKWALENKEEVKKITQNANALMDQYENYTRCYLWRLFSVFSEALDYDVAEERPFPDSSVYLRQKILHKPTPNEAREFDRECLHEIRSF